MNALALRTSIELSTARIPAVGVSVIGCVLVFTDPTATSRWASFFQDTGMYLSVLSFAIAGSLFIVAGYWSGARSLAEAPEISRSVRTPGQVLRFRVSGDLTWLLASLAIVHVAAYSRTTALNGAISFSGASLSLLGFCSAVLCYALGLILGFVVRRAVGALVVAVIPYGLTLYANGTLSVEPATQPFARLVAPYIDQSWGPFRVPAHGPILLLAAYCALLAATLLGISRSQVARRPGGPRALPTLSRAVAVPLVGAVLAGGVIASTVPASAFSHQRIDGYSCSTEGSVCAWDRGAVAGLHTWVQAYDDVQGVLGTLPRPDLQFAEYGAPTDEPDRVVLAPPPGPLHNLEVARLMLTEYTSLMAATTCSADSAGRVAADLNDLFQLALGTDEVGAAQDEARRLLDECAR